MGKSQGGAMSDEGRLQNLRDFTVQICHAADGAIVGTGVAVSMGGQVVTCRHVVEAAGVDPRRAQADGEEVGVYFPQAAGGEVKKRQAAVSGCFPQHDDDVVLLQLVGGPSPLAPEQIAVLGRAEDSAGNPFRSYGYRQLNEYQAGWADGTIQGCVECPEGRVLLTEPVQLKSGQIDEGMSGAAVLDAARNLVVGIVAEAWFPPDQTPKDVDTAWAVNARVLSLAPLGLPLRDEPLPLSPAPQPKTDMAAARAAVAAGLEAAWNNAPPSLDEWVGRDDLLKAISADWADPGRRVTGLIGFGGEGKSSLARRWVDDLLSPVPEGEEPGVRDRPDGLFWWGFYERPSVNEFFEAALKWLSGGQVDPRSILSSTARAAFIGGMLTKGGRYLFVLDGLEVMQHQEGDQYGMLKSADLRDFLGYLAGPGHRSFGLVTSRAPLLDLVAYLSYTHRDVERLSPADGRALLRRLGVKGPDAALDKAVAAWDGHALTLGLLGGLLAERHGGDVSHLADLPPPVAGEPRYERVHRVLRRYDEHLADAERAFLTLFSAFRTPVDDQALQKVFRAKMGRNAITAPIAKLKDAAFQAMVQRLVDYRLLRRDAQAGQYTAHPLVRAHYFARLTAGDRDQTQAAHGRIKDYYLAIAGDTPYNPTLDDLKPLIEVVHHACQAGAYDEAVSIVKGRIYQGSRYVLPNELGAWETDLALMLEFFPTSDTSQEPQMSDPKDKSLILNEAGLCLMSLGRLGEAAPFYERANQIKLNITEDWNNASIGYQNLADLHAHLGALAASAEAAGQALALARRTEDKRNERDSLAYQAWAAHLQGDVAAAGAAFARAETLGREVDTTKRYRYSLAGILHADHLRRAGDAGYARRVTEANLEICERNRWPDDLSRSHRVLGDLDAGAGQHEAAGGHYDAALKIARGISRRDVLIEALLARGRWTARHRGLTGREDPSGLAYGDLDEALAYAVEGGYRIYEADCRVALAWAHLADLALSPSPARRGTVEAARAEAERARQMSADMGYHWGEVDAQEVLDSLNPPAGLEPAGGGLRD